MAKRIVDLYRQLTPPQHFEVVEIVPGKGLPTLAGEFLGFDLSTDYRSFLEQGLRFDITQLNTGLGDNPSKKILPLLDLCQKYFSPQLNSNGLFNDYELARFCLDCLQALRKIVPNLIGDADAVFEVFGLWKVYPSNQEEGGIGKLK